jgi:hypothetical protein
MIAISHPQLRPETGKQIVKYSQKNIDLLNLETNEFTTRPVRELLASLDYPNIELLISTISDDFLSDSLNGAMDASSRETVLTFNNLINKTSLVRIMDEILNRLENAWGQPVDIEFTALIDTNGDVRINLLQCRPLRLPRIPDSPTILPKAIDTQNVLFKSNWIISGGIVDSIRYVIFIDPAKYAEIESLDRKRSLGRVVGRLNDYFRGKEGKVMAVGPGRWGSSDIELGVNVSYADIDSVAVLAEMGQGRTGNEVELSYGTHFFQDLVEADITYLPVFPDKRTTEFNRRFFTQSPNILAKILPEYVDFEDLIRVIDVPSAYNGVYAHVIADAGTRRAVCYLK